MADVPNHRDGRSFHEARRPTSIIVAVGALILAGGAALWALAHLTGSATDDDAYVFPFVTAIALVLWVTSARRATEPQPEVIWEPCTATVTGSHIEAGDDELGDDFVLTDVSVATRDGSFDASLADLIAAPDRERFTAGTRWQVYRFADHPHRVLLTEAHEDVLRHGYNLDGIQGDSHYSYSSAAKAGSPFWDLRFDSAAGPVPFPAPRPPG